jgi:endonuclease/exonuclease/phosphatase family metal-dependent hydrolase
MLGRPDGRAVLRARAAPFSVMTQNMALLVFPGDYLGTDREGAIVGLVAEVRRQVPDVVGLCEVFADDEREHIRGDLATTYPFFVQGPDEDDLESDGGLLVLSRHPFTATSDLIYRDCAGNDCFANKGVLHVRVQPPGAPTAYDLFYTHMQNIEEDGGDDTLYSQLSVLHGMIQRDANPAVPTLVFGDLNVPASAANHYEQLLARLARPADMWVAAGNTVASGFTVVRDSDFFDDADDRPPSDERLDYVLMKPGRRAVQILRQIDVLSVRHNGRLISDHLGVLARFDQVLTIDE